MIYLSAVGMVNALGNSADEIAANLIAGMAPGMRQRAGWLQGLPEAVLGGVEGELPPVPESFSAHRSRNNQAPPQPGARSPSLPKGFYPPVSSKCWPWWHAAFPMPK